MNETEVKLRMPCGGTACFDGEYSYRCSECMSVVGSIGMPRACKEASDKYENWKTLGGKGWDYAKGEPA